MVWNPVCYAWESHASCLMLKMRHYWLLCVVDTVCGIAFDTSLHPVCNLCMADQGFPCRTLFSSRSTVGRHWPSHELACFPCCWRDLRVFW